MDPFLFDLWQSTRGSLGLLVFLALSLAEARGTVRIATIVLLGLAVSGRLGTIGWLLWGFGILAIACFFVSFSTVLVMVPFPQKARETWIELTINRLLPTERPHFEDVAAQIPQGVAFGPLLGLRLLVEAHLWRYGRGYPEDILEGWARLGEGTLGERLETFASLLLNE